MADNPFLSQDERRAAASDHHKHAHDDHGRCLTPEELNDIPEKHRKCEDLLCCLLFTAFWAGMVFVAIVVFHMSGVHGMYRVTHGMSYEGKTCGLSGDMGAGSDYKYLYWPEPSKWPTITICATTCPSTSGIIMTDPSYNGSALGRTFSSLPTKKVFNWCIPEDNALAKGVDTGLNDFSTLFTDLERSWPVVLACTFIAFLISLVFLLITRLAGGCLVYTTITLIVVGLGVAGYFIVRHSANMSGSGKQELQWIGISCFIVDFLFVCFIVATCKSLRVAVACIEEASKALLHLKKLILLPICKFFLVCALFVWFVVVSIYMAGGANLKSSTAHSVTGGETLAVKRLSFDSNIQRLFAYHFIGTLWTSVWIIAIGDIIIAGAVATWYFTNEVDGARRTSKPVSTAVHNALRYHMGSAALGSAILTVVLLVRWFLEMVSKRLKDSPAGQSKVMLAVLCICKSCVACFEACIKFLNRHAWIEIALFGGSFFTAARRGFNLVARNLSSVAYVGLLGGVFLLLGKLLVVSTTVLCAYLLLNHFEHASDVGGVNPLIPLVTIGLIAYVISAVFMQLFDMAVNTILHSYVADAEAHRGRPRYCPLDSKLHGVMRK